jgi:RNA polymerase sigma factor (sigma-70 family)
MPKPFFGDVLRYVHKTCRKPDAGERTDGELLDRIVTQRDEDAFAVLVERHGPMVLGVCRRVLGDLHLAEDSFQATFIVLARRAASIGLHGSLGPWLYAVAQRIACKSKVQTTGRRIRERRFANMASGESTDNQTWAEIRSVLDEEIGRLPEKYRAPLVLCYFEDKSQERAAQELGWAKGTLARRLTRTRALLQQQ